jgi:putative N6-adenine-specific DNA methylase
VVIVAADRDRGAIEATVANADRADVVIDAHQAAFSTHRPVGGPGWVVTNPPYGVRVGETSALRDLYDGFGNWLRAAVPGWTLAMVEADPRLGSRLRLDVATTLSTDNGGIKVRFVRGRIPDATLSR